MKMNNTNSCVCLTTGDHSSDFLIQLLISIIGAGVGSIIGAYFGLRFARKWDRQKRKEETQQTVINTLDAIIEEIKTIKKEYFEQKNIFLSWNSVAKNIDGISIMIRIPAYESSVNSGNFSLLKPSLQSILARLYLRLDRCIFYSNQVMNFYTTPIFASNNTAIVDREANRITNKFNEHMTALRDEIDEILPKLESGKIEDN